MTITTNPSRDEYTSSPGQTVFNYTFKIYANTDLNVYVTPEGQDADDAADISTDYTVDSNTIGDEAGGFITFNNPLADGDRVTISSNIPYNRTVDYQVNGDFRPDTVNSDNDRQVSQIKQIENGLSRTLQFPSSLQNATGVSMDSPESGKYVRWKSDLSGLENVELPPGQVAVNGVVLIYPDVATMKASTDDNLIPGITVATQGYYTSGDGGGARYLIATTQAADEYGDHTLTNGNVALLQSPRNRVDTRQFGAVNKGASDDSAAVQAAVDWLDRGGILLPEQIRIDTTILVHNKPGFYVEGVSLGGTVITTASDCLFDTSRLAPLGADVALQGEYNRNTVFIITTYDAENDRPNTDARQVYFYNMQADLSGSPTARKVSLVACPSLALAIFKDILVVDGFAIYDAWTLSNGDSRQYHLEFDNCRTLDCEHHLFTDWTDAYSTQLGTTWILTNNQTAKNRSSSIEIRGISYAVLGYSSVDNNAQGHYAFNIEDCRSVTIIEPGIESRYEKDAVGFGGGLLKISKRTQCNIISGFLVGGDRDGNGSGTISDYDDGSGTVADSLIVIDGANVTWTKPSIDAQVGTPPTNYPVYLENGANLEFHQGGTAHPAGRMDVNDTSTCLHTSIENKTTYISGVDNADEAVYWSGIVLDYHDENTLTPSGAPGVDLDTLTDNRVYRVNQAGAVPAVGDYTTLNHPEDNAFGILEVVKAGIYIKQVYTLGSGKTYIRMSGSGGTAWNAWLLMTS